MKNNVPEPGDYVEILLHKSNAGNTIALTPKQNILPTEGNPGDTVTVEISLSNNESYFIGTVISDPPDGIEVHSLVKHQRSILELRDGKGTTAHDRSKINRIINKPEVDDNPNPIAESRINSSNDEEEPEGEDDKSPFFDDIRGSKNELIK